MSKRYDIENILKYLKKDKSFEVKDKYDTESEVELIYYSRETKFLKSFVEEKIKDEENNSLYKGKMKIISKTYWKNKHDIEYRKIVSYWSFESLYNSNSNFSEIIDNDVLYHSSDTKFKLKHIEERILEFPYTRKNNEYIVSDTTSSFEMKSFDYDYFDHYHSNAIYTCKKLFSVFLALFWGEIDYEESPNFGELLRDKRGVSKFYDLVDRVDLPEDKEFAEKNSDLTDELVNRYENELEAIFGDDF